MKYSSSSMYNQKILPYYEEVAKNEYLKMVNDTFSFISFSVDELVLQDNYQNELQLRYKFNDLNNEIMTKLEMCFIFSITITNLGSAFREPGRRYLNGNISILSKSSKANRGHNIVINWMYKNLDQSSMLMLNGIEDKFENIQIEKMLKEAKEYINTYTEFIEQNLGVILSNNPELLDDFKNIKDIFVF